MTESALYLYCLVHAEKKPSLAKAPAGLPGAARPRAVEAEAAWWMIVGDVPAGEYDERAIEAGLQDLDWVSQRAVGHEQVVEFATGLGPVVPMKLFTLFHGEARAAAHVKQQRGRLEKIRRRIEGCAEWGVRVMYEPRAARAAVPAARPTSGADFLKRKQALQGSAQQQAREARIRAQELLTALEDAAQEARIRPPEEGAGLKLLGEGAYLVRTGESASFRSTVEEAARAMAPEGLRVDLTGPWPAYHFVVDAA